MTTLTPANLAETGYAKPAVLYRALELSQTKWGLWFSEGNRERRVVIPARDVSRLTEELSKAKEKFGLPAETPVKSVYEAGRDGFWIHRLLLSLGVENQVIDSASIEVERHARRVKTDGWMAASCYAGSSGMSGMGTGYGWCGFPRWRRKMPAGYTGRWNG